MHRFLNSNLLLGLVLLISCSESNSVEPETESFYINISQGSNTFRFSNDDFELALSGAYTLACSDEYIYGKRWFSLVEEGADGFKSPVASFGITRKVFKDELDLSDETSYTRSIVASQSFGFPVDTNGYYTIADFDEDLFVVEKGIDGEAFLYFKQGEDVFNTATLVPNNRDSGSYFNLEKTIDLGEETPEGYRFIIQGSFRVNMFPDNYGNESVQVEGEFRWPVYSMTNSEILEVCP